jgi:hypothetical protein
MEEGLIVSENGKVQFRTENGTLFDLPPMDILKEVFLLMKKKNNSETKKLIIDPFTEETFFFRNGELIKLPMWKLVKDIYNVSVRRITPCHSGSPLEKSRQSVERYKDVVSESDWKILESELDVRSKYRSRKWHLAHHRAYSTYRRRQKANIPIGSIFPELTEEEKNNLTSSVDIEASGTTFTFFESSTEN